MISSGGSVVTALLLVILAEIKTVSAVRGCTVIAIQPDLRWKKAVCDSDSSQLTSIPSDLPEMLISLRVTQQFIRHLDEGALRRLVNLEEFYLDSCQLEKVDLNAFKGLNRLRILSLRNNTIRLDEGGFLSATFDHLTALEVLDLSENPLGRMPPNFFPASLGKSLFELKLSHTKGLTPFGLDIPSFLTLSNLQVLDLSFTNLETLSSEFRAVFNRMERLRELQLGGNPWHCDCSLRWMREWYLTDILPSMQLSYSHKTPYGTLNTITPTCKSPYAVQRRLIFIPPGRGAIEPEDFICKQWIDTKHRSVSAVAGGNLSLICHGYFEVPQTVQWLKDKLPLVKPPSRYVISQTNSLEYTAYLNISHVTAEDGGTFECGLEDAGVINGVTINVTVKTISGSGGVSRMDETERQNLVYAGIGVAAIFILLAAIAMTVFCCWGSKTADKRSVVAACAAKF